MKKLIAIMLVLICVVGVFAGCSGPGTTKGPSGDGSTITIGIPVDMNIEDYETNSLTLWIEEQTGYKLEFKTYASDPGDYGPQLSGQIMAEETLPHMLFQFNSIPWEVYGEEVGGQRYFLDLTDYLMDKEGKAKNWWEMAEMSFTPGNIQSIIDRCKNEDGEIIAFPTAERSLVDRLPFIAHINQEWLAKVGMDAPTDPESLLAVLRAFKEQCCTGRNSYPLLGAGRSVLGSDVIWWIINMFCPGYDYDNYFSLSADGKTLTTPFTTPEYRKALIYIKQLVDEGLMPKEVTNWEQKDVRPLLENYEHGVLICHTTPFFVNTKNEKLYKYVPLDLYGYCQSNLTKGSQCTFITEQAEIDGVVDACWDILMLLCTKEGSIRLRYGDEGLNWTWNNDPNVKSYLGLECWINLVDDPFGRPNNEMWGTPNPTVNPQAEGEFVNTGEMSDWMKYRFSLNGTGYENFIKREQNNKYVLPDLVMTATEDDETKNERMNTQNALKKWESDFCQGLKNAGDEATWQQYLSELNTKGLQTWLAQYQRIYAERYMADLLAAAESK